MAEDSAGSGAGASETFEPIVNEVSADGMWAAAILGAAIIIVIFGGIFYSSGKGKKGADGIDAGDFQWGEDETEAFAPPAARGEYIEFKKSANVEKAEDLKQLKKCLMQRCYKAIPLLHELQNGAPSADRLYKKGMITDATYERFKHMKAFFDVEFPEVQAEANKLYPGWEKTIWQEANQFFHLKNKQKAEAQGVGARAAQAIGGDDDDDDSIMITSPAKEKGEKGEEKADEGNGKKGPSAGKSKAVDSMNPEQRAEHFRAQLEKEEAKEAKGRKTKSK